MKLRKIISAIICAALIAGTMAMPAVAEETKLLAFSTAEGGGKYTTGARGADNIEVYHVTNLNDEGEGSLRDAVSKEGRVVVFDISGIITLKSKLTFDAPNITVLGQTAPGDGITITGYDAEVKADNIILRYLRIRPTDSQGAEPDGLGGRWVKNVIIDHCSVSWGVDELLTLYAGSLEKEGKTPSQNVSVQYCLSAESLRMSNHIKGAHGYGGIIGGTNATYHHNLFAHHDSRNPRFDRNLRSTDMVNNVIYNWGNNSAYGAEPYSYNKQEEYSNPDYVSNINIRNNYYKSGPNTKPIIRSKIFEATNDESVTYKGELLKSNAYISGNFVYGDEAATADNTKDEDTVYNQKTLNLLKTPVDMGEYEINVETAENAYETTLATVGASLPRRDAVDARIVNDVKNGTGRIINKSEEVGAFAGIESETRVFEIPAEWKAAHNMADASDADIAPSSYTWIEEYVNEWTDEQNAPSNPEITVISPQTANTELAGDKTDGKGFWLVTDTDKQINYKAEAKNAVKTELYDNAVLLKAYNGGSVDDYIALAAGTHYLTLLAYSENGEKTMSDTAIVYVTDGDAITEIGDTSYPNASYTWNDNGRTYISGSGKMGGSADSFAFKCEQKTGDFVYTVKIDEIPKYENGALAGIMIREDMDENSRMVMLSDTWKKYGENIIIPQRTEKGGELIIDYMPDAEGNPISNAGSYDTNKYPMPKFMRVERTGDKLILSVSDSGTDFTDNTRQPVTIDIFGWSDTLNVGLAVDSVNGYSNEATPMLPWYTIVAFTEITDKTRIVEVTYDEAGKVTAVKMHKTIPEEKENSKIFIF
ncbi:MAG: hypothetical protein IJJ55_03210 [Clostridia bacterium]|nr:hypothetical protein [Clostridia bacterium]